MVWGTGQATRDSFMSRTRRQPSFCHGKSTIKVKPVNIGAGFEISIRDLVTLIAELTDSRVGSSGTAPVRWSPRRMLDTRRAYKEFGFQAKTDFRLGLKKTIEWYVEQRSRELGTKLIL